MVFTSLPSKENIYDFFKKNFPNIDIKYIAINDGTLFLKKNFPNIDIKYITLNDGTRDIKKSRKITKKRICF